MLVAIDAYQDAAFRVLANAEAAAGTLATTLTAAGYAKEHQFLLLGSHATKAIVESRIRTLRKRMKKGDSLLVWFDARGFSRKGAGVIAAWDSLAEDLIDTSVSVAGLVRELVASRASQIVFLLDVGGSQALADALPEGVLPHLDSEELNALFSDTPKAVCLTSTIDEEESLRTATLKSSAWAHLVLEAVAGRGAKAITSDGAVTAVSLQRYVDDELPRVLRKQFEGRVSQSPRLFGEQNGATPIADLSSLIGSRTGGGILDPQRLKRIVFRSESTGRVKDLSGFRKSYKLPDHAGPSSRIFIAMCATDDVRADLNSVYEAVRVNLDYKRRDIDTAVGSDGFGSLRTPDFEYTVAASLDTNDPTQVIWRREVGQLSDVGFVRGAAFEAAFGRLFDQLVFEFVNPVQVDDLVDRLEDEPIEGVKVSVESDGSACEVSLAGFNGVVRVERGSLSVRGRSGHATGLLDQFLEFVRKVGTIGEPLGLPAKS